MNTLRNLMREIQCVCVIILQLIYYNNITHYNINCKIFFTIEAIYKYISNLTGI